MIVKIYKAQPVIRNVPVENVTIEIHEEIPEFNTREDSKNLYAQQADDIANALLESLPGGTIDMLTANLLDHKATLLRVVA